MLIISLLTDKTCQVTSSTLGSDFSEWIWMCG